MTAATPRNTPDSSRFLAAIRLSECEPVMFDRAFEVTPQYVPWPKAYGGDAVAQAAAAAMETVGEDRTLHSLHSSFLRPVTVGEVVRYEVELVRDGRGYSTRHVRGVQGGKTVFMTTASFQVPEAGPEAAPSMPLAPRPEQLPSAERYLVERGRLGGQEPRGDEQRGDEPRGDAAAAYWASGRSFDMRHIPSPVYTEASDAGDGVQGLWLRAFSALPDDPRIHQLALAYACDYTILEPSLRALGLHWSSPGLDTASLDHAMWFHQSARIDEWVLYSQACMGVQSGRGLNTGRFFTEQGRLIATVAQEGLIRRPENTPPATDPSHTPSEKGSAHG